MYSYDEIYGLTLEEYLKAHNKTLEELITKIETDIKLLRDNLYRLVRVEDCKDSSLIKVINDKIKYKEEHLKRLKRWKRKK